MSKLIYSGHVEDNQRFRLDEKHLKTEFANSYFVSAEPDIDCQTAMEQVEQAIKEWESSLNCEFKILDKYQSFSWENEKQQIKSCSKNIALKAGEMVYIINFSFAPYDFSVAITTEDDVVNIQKFVECFYKATKSYDTNIHIVSVYHGEMRTRKIKLPNTKNIDICNHYNDSLAPIHQKLLNDFASKKNGLVLFHGNPGTGKTTYIHHLISCLPECTFMYISQKDVQSLSDPSYISSLFLEKKDANLVLVIEDAEDAMGQDGDSRNAATSTILNLADGLLGQAMNCKIIATFNKSVEGIDKALIRKGRLIANYHFDPLTVEKANRLAVQLGQQRTFAKPTTLADIFNEETNQEENFAKKEKQRMGFQ